MDSLCMCFISSGPLVDETYVYLKCHVISCDLSIPCTIWNKTFSSMPLVHVIMIIKVSS